MSAGRFVRSTYARNTGNGDRHPIRVQPETIALSFQSGGNTITNAAPNEPPSEDISAIVSRSARGLGLRPRSVTLELLEGQTPPTGYIIGSLTRIPILRPEVFDVMARGLIVTYLSVNWQVVSLDAEDAR